MPRRPPVTVPQILAWAEDHRRRTGRWPRRSSGRLAGALGESWVNLDQALRVGLRGLPGGDSLARLLTRERGMSSPQSQTPLTGSLIVAWAREHLRRTGEWPTTRSGPVKGQPGETWVGLNSALRYGCRGLPGGDTLHRLLKRRCGVRRSGDRPPLTIDRILAWADRHHERTGDWPRPGSGKVRGAAGETWRSIDGALRDGHRGLPGGSSLPRLLAEHRGRRNKACLPRLTLRQVLAWADAHQRRTGRWPGVRSGPVPEAPGESWQAINLALFVGLRGLPGGDSLARLLRRHGRRRTPQTDRQRLPAG
jgi:hypothetical protein